MTSAILPCDYEKIQSGALFSNPRDGAAQNSKSVFNGRPSHPIYAALIESHDDGEMRIIAGARHFELGGANPCTRLFSS